MAAPGSLWVGMLILGVVAGGLFADVVVSSTRVLSAPGMDIATQFVHWRRFGFDELGRGNLPLWNPYVLGGVPFFPSFQSALLYPPNWLHLVLPLGTALNVVIVLHVLLAGMLTYLWVALRGVRPAGALLAALMVMLGGPFFLHIYAGHLSNLCTMAWVPLVLLCIDGVWATGRIGWALLGIATVVLLVLAGHPQYVFYAGVTCALYGVLCAWRRPAGGGVAAPVRPSGGGGDPPARPVSAGRALGLLLFMVAGAAAVTAIQLLPGMDANRDSVRGGGVPYAFAAMFSFPPENVVTLLAPGVLGGLDDRSYWGRCYLWEMSLFMSATGVALAVWGAAAGRRGPGRHALAMVGLLFVLALGAHTPLFPLLYAWVPGFDLFRGTSKFTFPMALFVALLAGVGLDRVLTAPPRGRALVAGVVGAAVVVASVAAVVAVSAPAGELTGWWHGAMTAVAGTGESYLPAARYTDPVFGREAAHAAARALAGSAAALVALAAVLAAARRVPRAAYGVLALALVELVPFAWQHRPTFTLASVETPPGLREFYRSRPGDYRVLNTRNVNVAMDARVPDVWGLDGGVSRRWSELVTATQGGDPDRATHWVTFQRREPFERLYRMLRLRYWLVPGEDGTASVLEIRDPLPHVRLIDRAEILTGRDRILARLQEPDFDPTRTVVLEQPPDPAPAPGAAGSARVVETGTDHLVIEAEASAPSVLLVTDGYRHGWQARPLGDGPQATYDVLPANYVLRAIPLEAGRHRLLVEYLPRSFVIGRAVSITALLAYLGALAWWWIRRRHAAPAA